MKISSNYKIINFKQFLINIFQKKRNIFILIFLFGFTSISSLYFFRSNLRKLRDDIYALEKIDKTDFITYFKELTTSYDWGNKIQRVDLNLNYENILLLDCLRSQKSKYLGNTLNNISKNKEDPCNGKSWAKGKLEHNNIIYPIKLRAKGDRDEMHRKNFKTMSFKIDIRGEKRYMGMEEFSIQSPIIRNYTSELLTAKLMSDEGISSPRHHYIRLFINGEYLGLRHIEESFSRELIEASKKRYGPVFSLNEEVDINFGKTRFDLSDLKQWNMKNKKIASDALTVLEVSQKEPNLIKSFFDLKLWAKYFALADVLYSYHGVLPKSVKFYLNPTTGLFEPAFFDGHKQERLELNDFLLSHFARVNSKDIQCKWFCDHKSFYQSFFKKGDKIDDAFYIEYFNALKKYSSKDFQLNNIESFKKDLSPLRGALYREYARRDALFHKGYLPHIEKHSILNKRIEKIRSKINKAENDTPYFATNNLRNKLSITNQSSILPQILGLSCQNKGTKPIILSKHKSVIINLDLFKNCSFEDLNYSINNGNKYRVNSHLIGNLDFEKELINTSQKVSLNKDSEDFIFEKKEILLGNNLDLHNKNIIVKNDVKICLENSAILRIKDSKISNIGNKKISFFGCGNNPGSVMISNSNINLYEIEVNGLSSPKKQLRMLYGGLNIINSNLKAKKLFTNSSRSEDGVNFINSNIEIDQIKSSNILSDAVDSDSSNLEIGQIFCNNVKNDCLDLSYSSAKVSNLVAKNIGDKAISAGESSIINLENVIVSNSEMGLVAKDSSKVFVKLFEADSVTLPIAAYIKKAELGPPLIKVMSLDNALLGKSLISDDSNVYLVGKKIFGKLTSNQISDMLYGNLYGVKTIR